MAKILLRISIIVMLLLGGAALTLGYYLYEQREVIKGRTQKLENTIKRIAATVETGDETGATITLNDDQLKDFERMDGPLNQLSTAAQYQLSRLNMTRQDLSDTKETLNKTEEDFLQTTARLKDTTQRLQVANNTITDQENEIREKEVLVQNLQRDKIDLEGKVAELDLTIQSLQVDNRDLTDKVAEQATRIETLEAQADPTRFKEKLVKGRQGVILYVDRNWSFVIFDIAPEGLDVIVPDLELLVHRGDQFIGKVRVANVEANLAVADIIHDWQQFPVEKNDEIIY